MFRPYSVDMRERAIALLDEGFNSIEVGEMLGVHDSWVRKMRIRLERLGHLIPGSPPGRERLLNEEQEQQLCLLVLEQPDATLEEIVVLMKKRLGVRVSVPTVSRRLTEMGMSRKKSRSTPLRPTTPRSNMSEKTSSDAASSAPRRASSSSTRRVSISR
jgi:transposase